MDLCYLLSKMKLYYLLLIVLLVMLHTTQLWAQQEVNYTLYRYHLNLINPATTGTQGASFLNTSLRTQWVGIEDAPETQAISIGLPHANNRLGTGFSVINDRTFVENQAQLFLDFSYRLPLDNGRDLFLGLKAGGTSIRLKTQALQTYGSTLADPLLQSISGFVPNFGVGVYYKTDRYYLSVSIPRLLQTERFRKENEQITHATDRPHLFASTGFRAPLSANWTFTPAVLLSYVEAAPIEILLDAGFSYRESLTIGAQYTRSGGIGGVMSLQISDGLQLGYAYVTSSIDQVNRFSNGTHEMLLKIRLSERLNDTPSGGDRVASFTREVKEKAKANERKIGTKNQNNKINRQ